MSLAVRLSVEAGWQAKHDGVGWLVGEGRVKSQIAGTTIGADNDTSAAAGLQGWRVAKSKCCRQCSRRSETKSVPGKQRGEIVLGRKENGGSTEILMSTSALYYTVEPDVRMRCGRRRK